MQLQWAKRISKLRTKIAPQSLESLLITEPNNITYLTGEIELSHDWRDAVLFVTQDTSVLLISPLREKRTKAKPNALVVEKSSDFFREIKRMCTKHKISSLGFEQENLRVSEYKKLKKILAPISIKPTKQIVEKQRMIKDRKEIEKIRKASLITVSVYKRIKKFLSPGSSEKEIAGKIEKFLKDEGSDGLPIGFSPIVAFGANSAVPHHIPTNRQLRPRDLVLIDFGCTYRGYASDLTRAVFVGKPTNLEVKVLSLVKKAQKRAIEAFAETNDPRKIDQAARDVISKSGYEKCFIHGTGHSLGLSIHEAPTLNQEEKTKIQSGMIFTVEPGVYIPNKFGIRHEDTILVKSKAAEILTKE